MGISNKWIVLFLATLSILSCRKEGLEDSIIPQITITNVDPMTVTQFEENLSITIQYSDANGDLGEIHPDSTSLYVLDSRLAEWDDYHVPPLSPIGSNVSIKGEIKITLQAPFLLGNGDSEVISYQVKMRDRAGNWSNIATTQNITITP